MIAAKARPALRLHRLTTSRARRHVDRKLVPGFLRPKPWHRAWRRRSQVADLHQEKRPHRYEPAPGCTVAANKTGEPNRKILYENQEQVWVSWPDGNGSSTWDVSATILVDYELVEQDGHYYVNVTRVRLGYNWIGDSPLEDVSVPRTAILTVGTSHVLEYEKGLQPQLPGHENVWGAEVYYRVYRVGEVYVKIPFIWRSPKLQKKADTPDSEGTIVIFPSLIPEDE